MTDKSILTDRHIPSHLQPSEIKRLKDMVDHADLEGKSEIKIRTWQLHALLTMVADNDVK